MIMSENMSAFLTLQGNAAVVLFKSKCSADLRYLIQDEPWLSWKKMPNAEGKDVWHVIADLTDKNDKNEYGQNRLQRLAEAILDDGFVLFCRNEHSDEFDSDFERYIYGEQE